MGNLWNYLLLSRVQIRRPRWFAPLMTIILIALLIAAFVYAYVFVNAALERSHASDVTTHHKR
jgi:hypothetical protein